MESTVWGFILGGVLGLVGSYFASFLFWKRLNVIEPKVAISPQLARSKSPNYPYGPNFRIKIVNLGGNQVINISVNAWLAELTNKDGIETTLGLAKIFSESSPTLALNPSHHKKTDAWDFTNTVILPLFPQLDIEEALNEKDNRGILFAIRYSDALSGSTIVEHKVYKKYDIVDGRFKADNTLKIVSE